MHIDEHAELFSSGEFVPLHLISDAVNLSWDPVAMFVLFNGSISLKIKFQEKPKGSNYLLEK